MSRLPLWRRVVLLLCAVGFVVFLLPVFGGGLNIANYLMFLLLGLVSWAMLRWERFTAALGRLWRRGWGKVLLLVTGTGAVLAALWFVGAVGAVLLSLNAKPTEERKTLIVLGCQVRGEAPSLMLSHRVRVAGDYLEAHPEAVAVLSGGQGSRENISEAECMYRLLVNRGIDPARLYREDRSTTTEENLKFSKDLIAREGLDGRVVVVTNGFHIYRAMLIADRLDLDAEGLAARSVGYLTPTYVVREALGVMYYRLFGLR